MKELIAISAAFIVLNAFDKSKAETPRKHKYPMEGIRREQRVLKIVAE